MLCKGDAQLQLTTEQLLKNTGSPTTSAARNSPAKFRFCTTETMAPCVAQKGRRSKLRRKVATGQLIQTQGRSRLQRCKICRQLLDVAPAKSRRCAWRSRDAKGALKRTVATALTLEQLGVYQQASDVSLPGLRRCVRHSVKTRTQKTNWQHNRPTQQWQRRQQTNKQTHCGSAGAHRAKIDEQLPPGGF